MRKSVSSLLKSDKLTPGAKGVLLVVGAYFVTIWVAIFIISFAIMILMMEAYSCSFMTRAMLVLWITIAVVFLASVIVVRGVAQKITPSFAGRLAIVATHGVALLVSYVIIAFVLLVAFNC